MDRFAALPQKEQDKILPPELTQRVAIELGSPGLWYRYAPVVIGLDTYGASGPGEKVLEHFGFTVDNVVKTYTQLKV
jgi:transketolase